MDVLSDVVSTIRSGRPRATRVAWHAPWGIRFPEVPGSAFHVVLQGSCLLSVEGHEPLRLGVGDVVFLPHGQGHTMADGPDTRIEELDCAAFREASPNGTAGSSPGPVEEMACGADGPRSLSRFGPASADGAQEGEPACVTLGGSYHACTARPHPLLTELPRLVHLPSRVGLRPELTAAVDLLGRELEDPRPGSDSIVPGLLDLLLVYILRAHLEGHDGPDHGCGWAGALRDPAVSAAVQAVHRDPAYPWTVAELGERAGLSRAAFSRRFGALVGQPPLAYVTWWRLTRAGRMLREGDAPISAIAARVGYSSQFAFAAAFKREFGVAPGRYRDGAVRVPEEV